MLFLVRKLRRMHVWRRIFVERLSEPLHLNLIAVAVAVFGGVRAKIAFDLLVRQQHAFALLTAADHASSLGIRSVTVVEFGVAAGAGLLNMCEIASRIEHATGVNFDIVGFDTGIGMPPPRDFRDHPEYYSEGDFPMNHSALLKRLPSNARLILGNLSETVPRFAETLSPTSPLGFVSVDVDYYWSARDALKLLSDSNPSSYLPLVVMYLDDIAFDGHNPWCGELLAVEEFNREHERRKITPFNFLRNTRIFKNAAWIDHMFTLHVLDHPMRQPSHRRTSLEPVVLENPYL